MIIEEINSSVGLHMFALVLAADVLSKEPQLPMND
jgi:hypothetical protein